jgi:hypothetical protein
MNTEYTMSNSAVAAFILVKESAKLLRIEKSPDNSRCLMVFDQDALQSVDEYWNHGMMEAKLYTSTHRFLRDEISQLKRSSETVKYF